MTRKPLGSNPLTMTHYRHPVKMIAASSMALLASTSLAHAAEGAIDTSTLLNMSLAELSNIEVTSVSKKAENQNHAAAAIYTITAEDIKRSGATAIPELLRMAPGVTVTKAGSSSWTVTARGFNNQFSNKLLVLMDGRTIYSPLFSGVIWDVQDTMIEDIDRIEVIRGPGATLWGANAVNGVINIITKHAKDTQDGLATAQAGNRINGIGSVRYGGKIGEESYYRAYVKQTEYDHEYSTAGGSANDDWGKTQVGFRTDSTLTTKDKLNVQGDWYKINEDANFTMPDVTAAPTYAATANGTKARGANLMATWEHKYHENSLFTLQTYIDYADYKTTFFSDEATTLDLDMQHNWSGWDGHDIVWGLGYRLLVSKNDTQSAQYNLTPRRRSDNLFSAFVQDRVTLVEDELFLTLGSKFEQNDYTGFEVQPSARMSWLMDDNQTLWASVSRAVHTPSRFTDDGALSYSVLPPGAVATLVQAAGNRNLDSEELIAYEIGYRIQPNKASSIDIAAFYNDYDNLFRDTTDTAIFPVFPGPYALLPVTTKDINAARSLGLEVAGKWNVRDNWQLAGAYSYIDLVFDNKDGGINFSFQGKQPKHQFNLRSTYQFSKDLEMTNAWYYVDDLNGVNIDGYHRFDTRVSYALMDNVDVSLIGQNLLRSRHKEFTSFLYRSNNSEIGRSVYGSIAIKF